MFHALANPRRFTAFATPASWVLGLLAVVLFAAGVPLSLIASPPDYQQGETVRIMYVHVPSAWLSLFGYTALAVASLTHFIWRHPLADAAARALALVGAAFTGLTLATGMIWGRPTWGAWWAWDARLTSVLVLFFFYLGYLALRAAITDERRSARFGSILAMAGFVNVPIVKFSVDWWSSLHQPASVSRLGAPTIHSDLLTPLFVMAGAFFALFGWIVLQRMAAEIDFRRADTLSRTARAPSKAVVLPADVPAQ